MSASQSPSSYNFCLQNFIKDKENVAMWMKTAMITCRERLCEERGKGHSNSFDHAAFVCWLVARWRQQYSYNFIIWNETYAQHKLYQPLIRRRDNFEKYYEKITYWIWAYNSNLNSARLTFYLEELRVDL